MIRARWWFDRGLPIAGVAGAAALSVSPEEWRQAAEDFAATGVRLMALWATRNQHGRNLVRGAFATEDRLLVLGLELAGSQYPGIEHHFPAALRMQRAAADLSGVHAMSPDQRPWLRHAGWPENFHPLVDQRTPPVTE
ncbi:MAG TPA: hypothetical protein VIL28_10780, partial [Steroidobacteraceae bacterium]